MKRTLIPLIMTAVASTACGPPGDEGFTLREIDGVVHADNVGPGAWADAAGDVLTFELEQTFGVQERPAEAIVGFVRDFAADERGRVYVLDGQAHRILAFESDGSLAWTAGREGEGPGDLMNPVSIAWNDSRLFVSNRSGTRVDRFDAEGVWIDAVALEDVDLTRASVLGFAPPELVVLQTFVMGAAAMSIHRFRFRDGGTWEAVGQLMVESDPPLEVSPMLSAGLDIELSEAEILVGNTGRYVVRSVELDATTRLRITRDFDGLSPPLWWDEGGRRGMVSMGTLHAPRRLASGHLLVVASWPTNVEDREELIRDLATAPMLGAQDRLRQIEYANSIDLFAANGRYLVSLTGEGRVPEIGSSLTVGVDGKLYTVRSDPYPHVRRYRVVIDEP